MSCPIHLSYNVSYWIQQNLHKISDLYSFNLLFIRKEWTAEMPTNIIIEDL